MRTFEMLATNGLYLLWMFKGERVNEVEVGGGVVALGTYIDVMSGDTISVGDADDGAKVRLDPLSVRVLVLTDDPCR